MGGLLASDAYRYLYEHELLDTTEPKAPPEGFFSRLFVSRSLASATAQENTADHSARHLVNITGLLAFDSPFFGLDPRIVTAGGPSRNVNRALAALPTPSVELLTSMLPETLSLPLGTDQGAPSLTLNTDWITAGATSVYKTLVPEGTTTPEQTEVVVVEEETVKETVGAAVQVTSGHVSTVSTSAEPTPESCLPTETAPTGPEIMSFSSNSATITATATESTTNIKTTSTMTTTTWNYVKYAAAGVGVAAAAVASIPLGLSFVPATLGSAWVVAKAEEARKHFEFLCPLATSTSEMEARIRAMNKAHDQGVAVFHCFYLEVLHCILRNLTSRWIC